MTTFESPLRRWTLPIFAGVIWLLAIAALTSIGLDAPPPAGLAAVLETMVFAGPTALAWLLSAIGWGAIARRAIGLRDSGTPGRRAIQAALGLAIALWLAHLLGVLGLFSNRGPGAAWLAWIPVMIGLAALALQFRAGASTKHQPMTLPPAALLGVPAVALLLAAATQPPGSIWTSEARGYDVLSYHLQLPKEWLAAGRIATLEHNVYSALPSAMESAYTQIAAMFPKATSGPAADEGWPVYAAQWLHALIALLAAGLTGRFVALVTPDTASPAARATAGAIASVALLATPWVIVTGSLAYNEMAVLALIAGALIALVAPALGDGRRGLLLGLLLGGACCAKPTALFMAALPTAVALALLTPPSRWWRVMLPGALAGLLMLAPWLIRNQLALGNPVFPFLTDVFSPAHWTADQAARFAAAHQGHEPLLTRALLLFTPRGWGHSQWGLLPLAASAALIVALASRGTRRPAALLGLMLAVQLAAWVLIGHQQSRFLLPAAVPAAGLIGLAVVALMAPPHSRTRLSLGLGAALTLALSLQSTLNFARQNEGRPNLMLLGGLGEINGSQLRDVLSRLPPEEQQRQFAARHAEVYVNLMLPTLRPGPIRLLLIGDATPLYYEGPVSWSTTWDRSPFRAALDDSGGDAAAAAARLRADGITHILVNFRELDRLHASGYADPELTPQRIHEFVAAHGLLAAAWTNAGRQQYLFELSPGAAERLAPPLPAPASDAP